MGLDIWTSGQPQGMPVNINDQVGGTCKCLSSGHAGVDWSATECDAGSGEWRFKRMRFLVRSIPPQIKGVLNSVRIHIQDIKLLHRPLLRQGKAVSVTKATPLRTPASAHNMLDMPI